MSETPPPPGAPAPRSSFAPLALGVALTLCAGVAVWRVVEQRGTDRIEEAPPESRGDVLADYGTIADFALVDSHSRPFTRKDLEGKIWVVDFIFTTCPGPCIPMTDGMRNLVSMLRSQPDVEFLSITVDPETDTPDALRTFSRTRGGANERWHWLTGEKPAIQKLALESFFAKAGDKDASGQVMHSTQYFVVDRRGHLRSVHDTQAPGFDPLPEVVHAVKLLLAQQPAGTPPTSPSGTADR